MQAAVQERVVAMPHRVPLVLYFVLQPKLREVRAAKARQQRHDQLVAK